MNNEHCITIDLPTRQSQAVIAVDCRHNVCCGTLLIKKDDISTVEIQLFGNDVVEAQRFVLRYLWECYLTGGERFRYRLARYLKKIGIDILSKKYGS